MQKEFLRFANQSTIDELLIQFGSQRQRSQ